MAEKGLGQQSLPLRLAEGKFETGAKTGFGVSHLGAKQARCMEGLATRSELATKNEVWGGIS